MATFANIDLAERRDFEIVSTSGEVPRAVAVAYDRKRLEVQAVPFDSAPVVPDAGTGDAGSTFQESCPGVIDLAAQECSVAGGAAVTVRLWNNTANPVSVYERPENFADPSQCILDIRALAAPDAIAEFASTEGAVIRVLDDITIQVVREVRLPAATPCDLVLVP